MPIRDVWAKLESNPEQPITDLLLLRLCPESDLDVFAALEPRTKRRILLLKSKVPPPGTLNNLPEGAGFSLEFVQSLSDQEGPYSLRFELVDVAYADVFNVVADDVVESISGCSSSAEAFQAFAGRIAEWQTFLKALPNAGLNEREQRGLFAELQFLRNFLIPACGPDEAVQAWAGPKALAKDFQFAQLAFEVKATTTKEPIRFHISSEIQLEHADDYALIVFGIVYERVLAGGQTLPALVQALRDELKPNPLVSLRFNELLLQVGYLDVQSDRYDSQLKTRSQHFFQVRDDFPRITGSDLPTGVADVRYSILLSECRRFELPEAEIREMLKEPNQ